MPQDPWAGLPDTKDPWAGLPDNDPGLLQQWNEAWFNQPLSHKLTGGSLAPDVSNYIDPRNLDPTQQARIPEWVPFVGGGTYRSLLGGMAEGGTNVLEGFTTPLNLATMGTGAVYSRAAKTATTLPGLTEAAYTTAPQLANVARRATQTLSAPVIASGAAKVGEGIRTGNYGDVGFGLAEMAGGTAGVMLPGVPKSRPQQPYKPPTVFDMDLPLNEPVLPPNQAAAASQQAPPVQQPVAPITPEVKPPAGPPMEIPPVASEPTMPFLSERPEFAPGEAPVEFVDPTTGELISQADAKPGDVLVPRAPVQAPQTQQPRPRRQRNMILTREGFVEKPETLADWIKTLTKEESGTYDPDALGRFIRDEEVPLEQRVERPSGQLQQDIQNLGLDSMSMDQVPNAVYYYNRTGRTEIVNYLLEQRMWPNFANLPTDEVMRHVRWYERNGNLELGNWLQGRLQERDAAPAAPGVRGIEEPDFHQQVKERQAAEQSLSRLSEPEFEPTVGPEANRPGFDARALQRQFGEYDVEQLQAELEYFESPQGRENYPGVAEWISRRIGDISDVTPPNQYLREPLRVDPNTVRPLVRRSIRNQPPEALPDVVARYEDAANSSETSRDVERFTRLANYTRDVIDEYGMEQPPSNLRSAQARAAVPPWNRREMDSMSANDLENYIRSYEYGASRNVGGMSRESQAIIDYANQRIQFLREQSAGGFEPDRAREAEYSRYNQQREEAFSGLSRGPSAESYAGIAEQVRRMTTEEVDNYVRQMGDNIYPEDIQPLIDEISRGEMTAGARAAVNHLRQQAEYLQDQGVATSPVSRRASQGPDPFRYEPEVYETGRGKTLEEVDTAKEQRTPAFERLARLIGEDRAREFVEGERDVSFGQRPDRPGGKKRVQKSQIRSWGRWAIEGLQGWDVDPTKPGIEERISEYYPDSFDYVYRNENGEPIGHIGGDSHGIHTFQVNPNIGLRRGTVAFELLGKAIDRGVNEPAGGVSDLTRNIIDRTKRIIERARRNKTLRDEKGELVIPESVIKAISDVIDSIADSRIGVFAKKTGTLARRFITEEAGATDPDLGLSRLRELFSRRNNLTPEELAEARQLAKEVDPEVITKVPESMQNPPFTTTSEVGPGGNVPGAPPIESIMGGEPRQPRGTEYQYGPTRPPRLGPDLPGMPPGRMSSGPGTVHPKNLPWHPDMPVPPAQPGAQPRQLGPTREPRLGPKRPRQPYVEQNPQLVQDLQNRIRKAFEEKAAPGSGPGDINKLMEDYIKIAKENPEMVDQGLVRQVLGANKAFLTSWDISAPGRQGKAFLLNKEFWTALPGMIRAWGSKQAADVITQSIIDHPSGYFKRGVNQAGKATKSFAELVGLDLANLEETFVNTRAGKVFKYSGIEKSSRAHTAFLNKLRSDIFARFMEDAKNLGLNPETNLALARSYATFINDATGRGSLNVGKWKLNKVGNEINDAFFAARNMSGQIRTWNNVLNPLRYAQYDPVLRKQALKSLFAIAGAGLVVGEVMREFMGAKVENNPVSSDFRKIKYGDTRIDLFGGYQQFPVAAMKFIMGKEEPASGEQAGQTLELKGGWRSRGSVAQRFFSNRLSPAGSFIWSWMWGREFDGKPFEVKRALYERTFPIAMKDMWELAQEDPGMAALLSPLILSGFVGAQHYGR